LLYSNINISSPPTKTSAKVAVMAILLCNVKCLKILFFSSSCLKNLSIFVKTLL
jgi:hypothetical protein